MRRILSRGASNYALAGQGAATVIAANQYAQLMQITAPTAALDRVFRLNNPIAA